MTFVKLIKVPSEMFSHLLTADHGALCQELAGRGIRYSERVGMRSDATNWPPRITALAANLCCSVFIIPGSFSWHICFNKSPSA